MANDNGDGAFAPDIFTAAQWYARLKSRTFLEGEKKLMLAILELAIEDVMRAKLPGNSACCAASGHGESGGRGVDSLDRSGSSLRVRARVRGAGFPAGLYPRRIDSVEEP